MDSLRFVIVGHVDHGKSTLIGRLLYDTDSLPQDKIDEIRRSSEDLGRETEFAYLLDHLEEERRQGITIDTTQVFFKTDRREYVIIDAPGHVEFVKNMITGASQAEAAILIVDAKEGVKEQTKRHAYILSLLGLNQVIVVMNKMDLVDFSKESFSHVRQDVEKFLGSININLDLCVPICALKGDNVARKSDSMGWYDGPAFLESLDALKSRESSEDKALIFPIQDVYKIEDKRIAVGRVEAGMIRAGQKIKVLPGGEVTAVKSIERFLKDTDRAYAGESIGIITEDSVFLNRGDVVCGLEDGPALTDSFQASIFWMSKEKFRKDERITIRCATQETTAKVEKINNRMSSSTLEILQQDADILNNLEVGHVAITTKTPIVVEFFNDVRELGRFVFVRDNDICAGGIVA
jgi:sulfate adenylyltransferase large subunit